MVPQKKNVNIVTVCANHLPNVSLRAFFYCLTQADLNVGFEEARPLLAWLFFFYMSYVRFVVSVLPAGPGYVLPKALCGSVAAVILTQIRKYAAAQEGKASNNTTSMHMRRKNACLIVQYYYSCFAFSL